MPVLECAYPVREARLGREKSLYLLTFFALVMELSVS